MPAPRKLQWWKLVGSIGRLFIRYTRMSLGWFCLSEAAYIPRNLPQQSPGTFPCNRTVCRICPHVNSSSTITTPKRHGTRGLLPVVHQMSIDSVYWGDWTQVSGSLSRTPQRCHQREEWPSGTCPLQFNKSYTGGHKGSEIEGRPSQPGLPKEAGDEADI